MAFSACPFCGFSDNVQLVANQYSVCEGHEAGSVFETCWDVFVQCPKCRSSGPRVQCVCFPSDIEKRVAKKLWNERIDF